jgi:hypothetical protein
MKAAEPRRGMEAASVRLVPEYGIISRAAFAPDETKDLGLESA